MKKILMKEKISPKNFLFLLIAGIINAFGVTIFLYPVKLYDSGISGLSMFLAQQTPPYLTLSVFLLVLNVPIFLFGLKRQGLVFTVYSLFSVVIYAVASFLITEVLPIELDLSSPLAGSDLLLCAVFGGIISGVGSGLVIRFGGAIDGIEILSVVFAKKLNITIGTFVMIFNFTLYIICGIVIESWILPLYSIVTYFAGAKTIDYIIYGFDRSKCAMIITKKPDEISTALMEQFGSGGTIIDAIGSHSRQKRDIIYFIINRFQINKMKNLIQKIDGEAFISLHEVTDVFKKQK